MESFDLDSAAQRSGVGVDALRELVALGIVTPDAGGRFSPGDVRRANLVMSLTAAGIPLDGLGAAIRGGTVSLGFLDASAFDRFAALSPVTFAEAAERSGVPLELVLFIREASGSVAPDPDECLRESELPLVDWIALGVGADFRHDVVRQMIRVQADGLRRMAETEASMWQSEVIERAAERGMRSDAVLGADFGDRMSELTERAVLSMYHLQQTKAWTRNLVDVVEQMLAEAGLHSRLARPPAMCFLDISGYTRLTQERGDAAAARLAEDLGRIVGRASLEFGGRAVKWLGDGVMLHFPDPGQGTLAAVEMAERVTTAGLPTAHVGLHAGPVIFQEGDYYGQTVNIASRIADYAPPDSVVVSQAVVEASGGTGLAFDGLGPVALKGLAEPIELFTARRAG